MTYTSRFVYIHQESYIYIYIQQDSFIYIKIRVYTSRFVYIQQDSRTEVCTKIFVCRLRFVHIWHKGKRDRWIDYRVFKRWPKNGGKHGEFVAAKRGSHLLLSSPWQKKCLMKGHESVKVTTAMLKKNCRAIFKFPVLAPSSLSYHYNPRVNYGSNGSVGEPTEALSLPFLLYFCCNSTSLLHPSPCRSAPPPPFAFVETQSGLP